MLSPVLIAAVPLVGAVPIDATDNASLSGSVSLPITLMSVVAASSSIVTASLFAVGASLTSVTSMVTSIVASVGSAESSLVPSSFLPSVTFTVTL